MNKKGTLRELFINVLPNQKIGYSGKLETIDNNGKKKYLKVNMECPNSFVFIDGDNVSFEESKNGKFAGMYANNISWLGDNDFAIDPSMEELANKIMKINDFMAVIQMGNPYVKDSTGYSNDKFHLGFQLSKYWLDPNYKNQKPLILQLAASLLRGHTKQLYKHSGGTITFREIEKIIPKASYLKKNKLLTIFRKRKSTIKAHKKSLTIHQSFYINVIKIAGKIVSITIYSSNETLINKIIDDFKFDYDTLDSNENKFENDIDEEDEIIEIENKIDTEIILEKCYKGMEKIKDEINSSNFYYLNIPYSTYQKNNLFIEFMKNSRSNFKWSEDYEALILNKLG
jgi:hypothetical protein